MFFPAPPPMKITGSCDNHFHKMHFGKKKNNNQIYIHEGRDPAVTRDGNVGWKQLVAHHDVHEYLAGDLRAIFDF